MTTIKIRKPVRGFDVPGRTNAVPMTRRILAAARKAAISADWSGDGRFFDARYRDGVARPRVLDAGGYRWVSAGWVVDVHHAEAKIIGWPSGATQEQGRHAVIKALAACWPTW